MHRKALSWLFLAGFLSLQGTRAKAVSIIESDDRLEVNWSTLVVRFYGEASVPSGTDGFRTAEKRAWNEGMSYAEGAVRNLNLTLNEALAASPQRLSDDAAKAAQKIASATHSLNTTYFANGTVRVYLESALPKALTTSSIHFRQRDAPEPGMAQYTGIVFKANAPMKPRALYQVIDERGEVLFDVRDMAQEAYKKNLMGRWFRRPTSAELTVAVGKSPLVIAAAPRDGSLVVQRDDWEQATVGHRSLLVNGTIAVALP